MCEGVLSHRRQSAPLTVLMPNEVLFHPAHSPFLLALVAYVWRFNILLRDFYFHIFYGDFPGACVWAWGRYVKSRKSQIKMLAIVWLASLLVPLCMFLFSHVLLVGLATFRPLSCLLRGFGRAPHSAPPIWHVDVVGCSDRESRQQPINQNLYCWPP